MVKVNSVLGCMSLETGAKIIGIFSVLASIMLAVGAIGMMIEADELLAKAEFVIARGVLSRENAFHVKKFAGL